MLAHDADDTVRMVWDNGNFWIDRYFGKTWKPLESDGDALGLAVRLKINIRHCGDHVIAWHHDGICVHKVMYGDDPAAATRLAIVTAAAEIGKRKANP